MASTTLAVASGALMPGMAGGTSTAGADIVYGLGGGDPPSTVAQRAAGGDRFLDDAGGSFEAPLGYALAFQSLLAEAWKGEPSAILRHLDHDGSCAPSAGMDAAGGAPAADGAALEVAALPDAPDVDPGHAGEDGEAAFADAGIAAGDLFGMS